MNKKHTAMILAAGKGTRLKNLTAARPKALLEINGITLLERAINQVLAAGVSTIIVNVHHFAEQVIQFLNQPKFSALDLYISDESNELLDTGGGLLKARDYFIDSQSVLIHNVDIISDLNIASIIKDFEDDEAMAWLLTQKRTSNRQLLFDPLDQLCGWKDKRTESYKWVDKPTKDYQEFSFSGIHLLKPALLAGLPVRKTSIIDLYLNLAMHQQIRSKPIKTGFWFDLGKKSQIEQIEQFFKQRET
ncbi:MAG: sugar phosphate nucleotidyltransferase [Bacteroidetes bacterium]|jgi:NDP-sugar pyrophosphorylase family protein|nr:sugar phosphate nucleotidyltransferase [Bacteroidota bacterium]